MRANLLLLLPLLVASVAVPAQGGGPARSNGGILVGFADRPFRLPAPVDSNSPAVWNEDGDLVVFTSMGRPSFSVGPSAERLVHVGEVHFATEAPGGTWLESVVSDEATGTLYGYYHREPPGVCDDPALTAPRIGAAVSRDGGQSWRDLGIVLTAPEGSERCDTANAYFAGGVGDFTAILDREQRYLYFFFTSYAGEVSEQGVAVARLLWADRDTPAGRVMKRFEGVWSEPGLGGRATPLLPGTAGWETGETDSFWGPSVHWNTALERYVMLLNHARGAHFVNDGIHVTTAPSLDASSWEEPTQIIVGGAWYPQVFGVDGGTDSVAGAEAWLCLSGACEYRMYFGGTWPAAAAAGRPGPAAAPVLALRAPPRARPRR